MNFTNKHLNDVQGGIRSSKSSSLGLQALLHSSFASALQMPVEPNGETAAPKFSLQPGSSRHILNRRRRTSLPKGGNVFDILTTVQAILDVEDQEEEDAVLSSMSILEPTPIAPHIAHIVDQVHVTENSWHEDEDFLLLLNPLLTKRKMPEETALSLEHEESSSAPMKKRQRMTKAQHNKVPPVAPTTVAAAPSDSSHVNMDANTRFRGYQAEQWSDRYEDLVVFCQTYGHCLVPHKLAENPALAQWVKRQRYQHKLLLSGKHSTLTEERILALESLGFVWDSHRAAWEERLDELRHFRAKHGHCNVPANFEENPTLAIWIKCQRRQRRLYYKGEPSNMNQERLQKMDALGFLWNPRKLHGDSE
jgi:Helicase associated domain